MKLFKKLAAVVAAFTTVAVVMGTTVTPVMAKDVAVNDSVRTGWVYVENGNGRINCANIQNIDLAAVYGVRVTFGNVTIPEGEEINGGINVQTPSLNWWGPQTKWSSKEGDGDIILKTVAGTKDMTLTWQTETQMFPEADVAEGQGGFAIQQWWNDNVDLTITKVELLAKDGSVIKSDAVCKAGESVNLVVNAELENIADGIQSKDMTLDGTKVSDKVIGLKPTEDKNSKVSFKVNVATAGKYKLEVVYNAKGDNRPMALKVNDAAAKDIALASTGDDYTTCAVKTIEVELKAGVNEITFSQASTYDNSSVKAPNLVSAKVVAPAGTPGTGVSPVAIVVAGLAMLVCAAFVVFTSKKRA